MLSGDPLAVGTMVEATWIDGREVYARKTASQALAVRCGRILDATGKVYRNGVILVQDGRIKGIGEDLAIPYGAAVLDLPDVAISLGANGYLKKTPGQAEFLRALAQWSA